MKRVSFNSSEIIWLFVSCFFFFYISFYFIHLCDRQSHLSDLRIKIVFPLTSITPFRNKRQKKNTRKSKCNKNKMKIAGDKIIFCCDIIMRMDSGIRKW